LTALLRISWEASLIIDNDNHEEEGREGEAHLALPSYFWRIPLITTDTQSLRGFPWLAVSYTDVLRVYHSGWEIYRIDDTP
jgi:hypothetical protein